MVVYFYFPVILRFNVMFELLKAVLGALAYVIETISQKNLKSLTYLFMGLAHDMLSVNCHQTKSFFFLVMIEKNLLLYTIQI